MNDHTRKWRGALVLALALLAAIGARAEAQTRSGPGSDLKPDDAWRAALDQIRPEQVLEHIKVLASDDFEGRGPGTPGEAKSIAYLTGQLRAMGLAPGNPDGTYLQPVPLKGFRATRVTGAFHVGSGKGAGKEKTVELSFPKDFMAVSRRMAPEARVDGSDVVFVGYGVVAPEYGWDDYKGLDARGKTLVMLVNDPPVPDPKDTTKLDPAVFKGRAMTYYGRWTYKYEIGAEKGAAAVILVHETGPAGYPFSVVRDSWGRENFDIAEVRPTPGQGPADASATAPVPGRVAVEGWITEQKARELVSACGRDFDELKKSAARRDFRPQALGCRAGFAVSNALREIRSYNVAARLAGSDPNLKKDTVVYTAHWDHLGRDPSLKGDAIYNGALDNASGVAAVLEMGRAFARMRPAPKRSILFLFVTAEEKGLLGAKYYAERPLYPLDRTLANINLDGVNLWGPTKDLISIGKGQTTLDDALAAIAARQGRTLAPDANPEKGYYFRSDHFEFAKRGVPAISPQGGRDYIGKPADFGERKENEYIANDYHQPSDEVRPDWDLTGAVADMKLLIELGRAVAQGEHRPDWKPDSEFRARRAARKP